MWIELIVGSALLLIALFCFLWLRDPALRERIERPKHDFLGQAQAYDEHKSTITVNTQDGAPARE